MPKIRHSQGLPIEKIAHSDLTDMPDLLGTNSDHDARYANKNAADAISGVWNFVSHPTGLDHDQIANIGVNNHVTIDAHIASAANPHLVTLNQAYDAGSAIAVDNTDVDWTLTVGGAFGTPGKNFLIEGSDSEDIFKIGQDIWNAALGEYQPRIECGSAARTTILVLHAGSQIVCLDATDTFHGGFYHNGTDYELFSATGDIVLDPIGNQVIPGSDNEDSLGKSGASWKDLSLKGSLTDPTFPPHSLTVADAKHAFDHITADGSSHTYINQSVTTASSPTFAGLTQIGDAVNYAAFAADGTLEFNGDATVWRDMQFAISNAKVPAANFPTWETFTANTKEYSFSVDDYIDMKASELPHWWKQGTDGHVHLHVTTKAANATGANRFAKFQIWIGYCDTDETWQETNFTAELTIPNGTAALQLFYLDVGNLVLTTYLIGSEAKLRVKRIAATGGVEYAGNIFLTQAGIHLECDTVGSREEIIK